MKHLESRATAAGRTAARVHSGTELQGRASMRGQWTITAYRAGWRVTAMKCLVRVARLAAVVLALLGATTTAARARGALTALALELAAPNAKWDAGWENLITDAGLNHMLDTELSAGTQVTTWYIGLMSATPTAAAGDTMSSHAGWTEITAYSESVRQTFVDGGVSAKSLSNSGSVAVFTVNANGTNIGGAFLTSNSTKGGTTGTLFAAGAFTAADKSLDNTDTLSVTCTFSAS